MAMLPEDSPDLATVFTFEYCFISRKRCAQIVPTRNKSCSKPFVSQHNH